MSDKPEVRFRIQHKVTGKFCDGGLYNQWSKKGKTWNSLGHLRTFLTSCLRDRRDHKSRFDFENWMIIEYVLTVKDIKAMHEVITPEKLVELLKN